MHDPLRCLTDLGTIPSEDCQMPAQRKYRETPHYTTILRRLLTAAKNHEPPLHYSEVFNIMGLKSGNYAAAEAGRLLDEINQHAHKQGEPLLSALVVNSNTGIPGEGFFKLAADLGRLESNALSPRKREFWKKEVQAIYSYDW